MSSLCKGKVSKGILKHTKHLLSLFRKWLHCNFCFFFRGGIHKTFWLVKKSQVNNYEFQFSVRTVSDLACHQYTTICCTVSSTEPQGAEKNISKGFSPYSILHLLSPVYTACTLK